MITPERQEWLLYANMLMPPVLDDSPSSESQRTQDFARNVQLTRKAWMMGVALASLDGPLPVMDTIAFVGVSLYTAYLWRDFYLDYY